MWYNKIEDERGHYQDENGTRYMVTECHRVIAPDGRRNAELGYTEFENMEECLTAWGLSQAPEPDYEVPEPDYQVPEPDYQVPEPDYETETKSISETDVPTTFSLRQSVEPISETKSTSAVNDTDKLSSTELLKKLNIKSFADIRNKLLAKFKKS